MNNLGSKRIKALIIALSINKTLTSLSLGNNSIIFTALERNTTLTSLFLVGARLGDKGAVALIEPLGPNTTFKSLNLGYNDFTTKGLKAIFQGPGVQRHLDRTDLERGNNIDTNSAKIISKALAGKTYFRILNLSYNQFGNGGAMAIAKTLRSNATLIDLSGNNIGEEGRRALWALMEANFVLRELKLDVNHTSPQVDHWFSEDGGKEEQMRGIESEALMAPILGRTMDRFALFHYQFRTKIDLLIPGLISCKRKRTNGGE